MPPKHQYEFYINKLHINSFAIFNKCLLNCIASFQYDTSSNVCHLPNINNGLTWYPLFFYVNVESPIFNISLFRFQESSLRSLRGGDPQAATKSSLADIEKRKKGMTFCEKKNNASLTLRSARKFFECKIASCRYLADKKILSFCVWSTKNTVLDD